MTVLGAQEIKKLINKLFQERTYNEANIGPASYDLRLGNEFLIDGKYVKNEDYIELPPRKLSQLSTMEKLNLPKDICGRVGITFSINRKGLIPLFGPQVDPCYEGKFYGLVYNVTSEIIVMEVGKPIFKMEFMKVEGETTKFNNKSLEIPKLDKMPIESVIEHTKTDSLGEIIKDIKDFNTELAAFRGRLSSVEGGYHDVIFFGIFLIAATILSISAATILTILFSNEVPKIDKNLSAFVIIAFLVVFVYLCREIIFKSLKKEERK